MNVHVLQHAHYTVDQAGGLMSLGGERGPIMRGHISSARVAFLSVSSVGGTLYSIV